MPLTSDTDITRVLTQTRTIALLGASDRLERPSHRVLKFLVKHGYEVFPVNPVLARRTLLGRTVYARLSEIPVAIDMLDVFRHPRHLTGIVDEAIQANVKVLWTQLGVVNEVAARTAERAGVEVVMDRCSAIEFRRLLGTSSTPGPKP